MEANPDEAIMIELGTHVADEISQMMIELPERLMTGDADRTLQAQAQMADTQKEAIEELWEISELPKDYRRFLLEYNGGTPEKGSFSFKDKSDGSCVSEFFGFIKGYNSNLLLNQKYAGNRVPQNMLPIADDVYGNLILLSIKGPDRGKVYFWDHEMEADPAQGEVPDYSNLTLIADSFDEFINSLHTIED